MPFQLLTAENVLTLKQEWKKRNQAVFEKAVVDKFVFDIVERSIDKGLMDELLNAIKYAEKKNELCVSAGLCYATDYRFTTDALGGIFKDKSMTIKQVIYRTNALERIAKELGPCIKVRPSYDDGLIFLMIEFWPDM